LKQYWSGHTSGSQRKMSGEILAETQ